MKKRLIWLIAIILIITGGLFFMRKNIFTGEWENEYRDEEERIALYFVNNYELTNGDKIEKIEFTEFEKNNMTGTWRITILVNDNFSISFKESKIGDKELYGTSYSMTEIKKLDTSQKNVALDDIKVDYTGE
ncbi:hypothetical protein [Streptococcus pluranimalium]|uniref:hypothetical protein n=1 Tax=Streptococcus pluranimalium TaxID=82348 RepID=UPI0039FD1883